jgi:hypothetical protein
MKQYDKIWVPSDDPTNYEVCRIKTGDPLRGWVDTEEDVIVLTIEELRDFYVEGFEDGYDSAAYSHGDKNYDELFKKYIQSKGITLL